MLKILVVVLVTNSLLVSCESNSKTRELRNRFAVLGNVLKSIAELTNYESNQESQLYSADNEVEPNLNETTTVQTKILNLENSTENWTENSNANSIEINLNPEVNQENSTSISHAPLPKAVKRRVV